MIKDNTFLRFLVSKVFFKQLKIALAVFFAIIFISSISLHFFTRHNSYIKVPNYRGLTLEQAQRIAYDHNMRVYVIDSVYHQEFEPGTVVEHDPKPGSEVKKNRRIFFVMNAVNPEMVTVPNIVGVSLRQALAILESNGLKAGKLRYVPDIATNNVLKQRFNGAEIKPGEKLRKGSAIDMVLGNAGSVSAEVPDLLGLTKRMAEIKISQASLNIGAVIYDKTVTNALDSAKAVIYKQKPDIEAYRLVSMGSLIDIWLTVKNEENE